MHLHHHHGEFKRAIEDTSLALGYSEAQIEKDYYLFLILKTLIGLSQLPVIFKGGTSLNQSFEVINRFSEDLDLSVLTEENQTLSDGKRKALKRDIIRSLDVLNLELINFDMIQSDRDFNRYLVQYESLYGIGSSETNTIRLEVMLAYRPFPIKTELTKSYIARIFNESKPYFDTIKPIVVPVQSLERTFIDKLFALADYHLRGEYGRNSRHLYDIHMIFHSKTLDLDSVKSILPQVFKERKAYPDFNPSAFNETKLNEALISVIKDRSFEDDFNQITKNLILDDVGYLTCIKSLRIILNSMLIENSMSHNKNS
jgi:predicted nucleotidyltransferase component of viral defense system